MFRTGEHILTWRSKDRLLNVAKADCNCGVSFGGSERGIRELHAAHVQEMADREQAEREAQS